VKLYYAPGACSLSPHIVLREAGLPFDLVRVNTKKHQTADGADFYAINDKGYVPVLEWDDGERLTEGPAIVQWIAAQAPASGLLPAAGTRELARLQEWLNFITSELHQGFGPLFKPGYPDEAKALAVARLENRLAWVDAQLAERPYLMGEAFTVADAYLFTVASWGAYVQLDISRWPNLTAHQARVAARPAVQQALRAEGLLKE
jgi:glutathione S-transferase